MSRTVLVVEDEAPIREMLKFVLEQSGFSGQKKRCFLTFEARLQRDFWC